MSCQPGNFLNKECTLTRPIQYVRKGRRIPRTPSLRKTSFQNQSRDVLTVRTATKFRFRRHLRQPTNSKVCHYNATAASEHTSAFLSCERQQRHQLRPTLSSTRRRARQPPREGRDHNDRTVQWQRYKYPCFFRDACAIREAR